MNTWLVLAFLFYIGSSVGWVIEVFFRHRFSSDNPEHKWVNPGFCTGPYLPIYGFGLCVLFIFAYLADYYQMTSSTLNIALVFLAMALSMTAVEYIAGLICIKIFNIKLWDYSNLWGNIQGIICPLFSFFWAILGAIYYFGIHPYVIDALTWLSKNLAFSFFIGLFFGVFIIDFCYSGNIVGKIKQYAKENEVIVRFERLKNYVSSFNLKKEVFLFPWRSSASIVEHLKQARLSIDGIVMDKKKKSK